MQQDPFKNQIKQADPEGNAKQKLTSSAADSKKEDKIGASWKYASSNTGETRFTGQFKPVASPANPKTVVNDPTPKTLAQPNKKQSKRTQQSFESSKSSAIDAKDRILSFFGDIKKDNEPAQKQVAAKKVEIAKQETSNATPPLKGAFELKKVDSSKQVKAESSIIYPEASTPYEALPLSNSLTSKAGLLESRAQQLNSIIEAKENQPAPNATDNTPKLRFVLQREEGIGASLLNAPVPARPQLGSEAQISRPVVSHEPSLLVELQPMKNNIALYQYVKEHRDQRVRPAGDDLKRLVQTLMFYAPDPQKNQEYEEISRTTKVFGFGRFVHVETAHDIPKLVFSTAILMAAKQLSINQLAALYLLEIYLKTNMSEFFLPRAADASIEQLDIDALRRVLKFDGQNQLVRDSKLLKDILLGVQRLYIQDTAALLAIFKEACQYGSVELRPDEISRAIDSTFRCFKKREEEQLSRSGSGTNEQEKCLQLLALLVQKDHSTIKVETILEIANKRIDQECVAILVPYCRVLNALLRLDSVARALNGGYRNERQLEIYRNLGLLEALHNHSLEVYRVITPAIIACVKRQPTFAPSAEVLAPSVIVSGCWRDWLELWCNHRELQEPWEYTFFISAMMRIYKEDHDHFWKHMADNQYSSTTRCIASLFKNSYLIQLMEILTILLGEPQHSHSEELLNNIGWICGREDSRSTLRHLLNISLQYTEKLGVTFILMLARMVQLEPWMCSIIERNLNYSLLEILVDSISKNEGRVKLQVAVFKALNSIQEEAGSTNKEVIRCLQNCEGVDFGLVVDEPSTHFLYLEYLQVLTEHANLLRRSTLDNEKIREWVMGILEFLFCARNIQSNLSGLELLVSVNQQSRDCMDEFLLERANSIDFDNVARVVYDTILNIGTMENTGKGSCRCVIKERFFTGSDKIAAKFEHIVGCLKLAAKCLEMYYDQPRQEQSRLARAIQNQFSSELGLFPRATQSQSVLRDCTLPEVLVELMVFDADRVLSVKDRFNKDLGQLACSILGSLAGIEASGQIKLGYRSDKESPVLIRLIECSRNIFVSGSPDLVDCLLRLLILVIHGNKLVGKEILEKLNDELAKTVQQVFTPENIRHLPSANKLLILALLTLKDTALSRASPYLTANKTLLAILTGAFDKVMYFGKEDASKEVMEDHRELLISNVCLLFSTMLSETQPRNIEELMIRHFFKIFSRETIHLIVSRQPNYSDSLFNLHKGLWLSAEFIDSVNIRAVYSPAGTVGIAVSLAYSNWCRLFLTIVNDKLSDLSTIKQAVAKAETSLEALTGDLLYMLSRNQLSYPEPAYFIVGAAVRINSNKKLARKVAQHLEWLHSANTYGKVFVIEAVYSILDELPPNSLRLEQSILEGVYPSQELLCLLNENSKTPGLFVCGTNIAREAYLAQNPKRFAAACHYLIERIRKQAPVEEVACKLKALLYEMDFGSLRCYVGYHRSPKHLNWCWLLVILREMVMQDSENPELAVFMKFLMHRTRMLTSEAMMYEDWYSCAHLEELGLVMAVLSSYVVGGGSIETDTVIRLFDTIVAGCSREVVSSCSTFEEMLSKKAIATGSSQETNTPAKQTYLRISAELTCLDSLWCSLILLEKLFRRGSSYLSEVQQSEVMALESSMAAAVHWLHDVNDRLGRSIGKLLQGPNSAVDQTLNLLNAVFASAEATIEMGYLNSIRERHTRESIHETIRNTVDHACKGLMTHISHVLGKLDKTISQSRLIPLEKCINRLSVGDLIDADTRQELRGLLWLRRH